MPIMTKLLPFSLAVTVLLVSAATATAGDASVQVVFTDGEIAIISAYYKDGDASHKGKRKVNKGLPPGIVKNLQRGKPLPPGIAKQALPSRLIELLPPPPRGFERVVLSGKVLLVEIATQVIHDVLEDVILGQ
jgi:hypothetical protein